MAQREPIQEAGKTGVNRRRAFSWILLDIFLGRGVLKAQSSARRDLFPAKTDAYLQGPPSVDVERLLNTLAVTSGRFAGAFRSVPDGPINWYFANLGLALLADQVPDAVRNYLNVYLATADPVHNAIMDVAADLTTPVPPDSNDAYAGTLLRLAVKYMRVTGDSLWWKMNLPRLKAVAYSNILSQVKPNGLVRVFQSPNPNGIGYLMDQCEVYSGLRDFAQYLIEKNDPNATYYAGFGVNLGIAIHSMFDANANRWQWADVPCAPSDAWYPNLTAQIYPHLHDVHSADAPGDYYRLHRGFEVLCQGAPNWMSKPQDLYPWLVVGYYAITQQNLTAEATAMLSMVLQYYLPGLVNTGRLLASEIGYVRGISAALASRQKAA